VKTTVVVLSVVK